MTTQQTWYDFLEKLPDDDANWLLEHGQETMISGGELLIEGLEGDVLQGRRVDQADIVEDPVDRQARCDLFGGRDPRRCAQRANVHSGRS